MRPKMTTDSPQHHHIANDGEVEGLVKYFVAFRYFGPSDDNGSIPSVLWGGPRCGPLTVMPVVLPAHVHPR
jgi:hypothetical protein